MKPSLFLLFALLFLSSCKEDELVPPFDTQQFFENYTTQNWTATEVKSEMIGVWQLAYIHCCLQATSLNWADTRSENIELRISDSTISLYEKDQLITSSSWQIDGRGNQAYYLDAEENINYTSGGIYFYQDYMLFYASPFDGPDKYFQKIR